MKSKISNISKLSWKSNLVELNNGKSTKTIEALAEARIFSIFDLLWIFPLKLQIIPGVQSFANAEEGKLFLGEGQVVSAKAAPAFGRKGKGRVQLFNVTLIVKDPHENHYLTLKWFNAYPNLQKKIKDLEYVSFLGEVKSFNGTVQIINPTLDPKLEQGTLIQYPTVNKIAGTHIANLIKKIPAYLWEQKINAVSDEYYQGSISLNNCFKSMHGINTDTADLIEIKNRLIFEEFFVNQLKIESRKKFLKTKVSAVIAPTELQIKEAKNTLPYQLTDDQNKALSDILFDFKSGSQMMRILQGDVGCGKTSVAAIATILCAMDNKKQVAIMCPTEALASQHAKTFASLLDQLDITYAYLVGSTKTKVRNEIYKKLEEGNIQVIIGTHALFQEKVQFKQLSLVIIDEQHKFGVEQRQKLVSKGDNPHCLLMTATPIPRTLQLAQYGDLEISTIRTMPGGRKGIKTRIVQPANYEKYLSFIKTRVSLGEQVYVVVPAIEESETLDIKNVVEHFNLCQKIFPELRISFLHGQMRPEEKEEVLNKFTQGCVDILISTSVIEVGINVINATVMSIYNPERFGLSSLHQLRGRVGRGEKPGFCFLVSDSQLSRQALERLSVVEKTTDGFIISEADLKIRGEGDLFGNSQSGSVNNYRLANVIEHNDVFNQVINLFQKPEIQTNPKIQRLIQQFSEKDSVVSTI